MHGVESDYFLTPDCDRSCWAVEILCRSIFQIGYAETTFGLVTVHGDRITEAQSATVAAMPDCAQAR
ncbi:hypothetical protein AWC22_15820 [Mycobacterium riyadhense]|uniref:Uncharacterized protein n=1 Tax=Mycobacterium riyadhense TaxID=486698 RepID=A0A1X2D2X0_9MYCO|nr:hypothetical protein AWC22_15820 [Mycobacterium riyadhense]